MHIAWFILKIILLTIGIFLGLALLLFILLLFVPIRYRVDAKFDDKPKVKLRVSWMSFFIDFKAFYRDSGIDYYLRSFGALLATNDEKHKKSEKTKKKIKNETKNKKKNKTIIESGEKTEEDEEDVIPTIDVSGLINTASDEDFITRFFHVLEMIFVFPAKLIEVIFRVWHEIREVLDNFRHAVDRLLTKLRLINKKREQLVKLYTLPTTKTAISNCKGYLLFLLSRLKPKKLTGCIEAGGNDPAVTGQLFGFLGLLLPIYYDNIKLTPNFNEQTLKGDIHMKGGITIACLLWILLKIYKDKYTMKTYERIRKILGGNKDGK